MAIKDKVVSLYIIVTLCAVSMAVTATTYYGGTVGTIGTFSILPGVSLTLSGSGGVFVSGSSVTAGGFFGNGHGITNVLTVDPTTQIVDNNTNPFNLTIIAGTSSATSVASCPGAAPYVVSCGGKCTAAMRSIYQSDPIIITGGGGSMPTSCTAVANSGTCIAYSICSVLASPNFQP